MQILSVKQPYAILLVSGIKKIEYRSWSTRYRGKMLIHASTSETKKAFDIIPPEDNLHSMPVFSEFYAQHRKNGWLPYSGKYLELDAEGLYLKAEYLTAPDIVREYQLLMYQIGHEKSMIHEHAILGHVTLTDCVERGSLYHWIVADPVWYASPILEVSGKLGLWSGEYSYNGPAIDYTFSM